MTLGKQDDDYALMARVAARDQAALSALYDAYAPALLGLCMRVTRNRADAEDVVVDLFYEIWERADRYDASRGSPMTYLFTLARSRAIDRRRSRASRPAMSLEENRAEASSETAASTPLEDANSAERRRIVRDAIASLDENQREAVELSFFRGLSHTEISHELDKPLGTVKTYVRQGLIRLRDALRNLS